jgi:hypothetical protein
LDNVSFVAGLGAISRVREGYSIGDTDKLPTPGKFKCGNNCSEQSDRRKLILFEYSAGMNMIAMLLPSTDDAHPCDRCVNTS